MAPYYDHNGIEIYHGDCLEVVRHIARADAVVSDPPYGMGWDPNTSRFSGGDPGSQSKRGGGVTGASLIAGDDEPFDPSPWMGYDHVILWGQNHFASRLPLGSALVWIKRNEDAFGSFLSDAEIAWKKGGHGVYCYKDLSMASIARKRVHQNQKPVGLMAWCLSFVPADAVVLDPYMGSGTTLVAAKKLGRRAIGIEIEEYHCQRAVERLSQNELPLYGDTVA